MPSGLTSTSCGVMGSIKMSMASRVKAVVERPWKERDQSTGSLVDDMGCAAGRGSWRPVVRSWGGRIGWDEV